MALLKNTVIDGHLIPANNELFDIGTANGRFRDMYLSGSTIDLGGAKLSIDPETGTVAIVGKPTANAPSPKALIITSEGKTATSNTTNGAINIAEIQTAVSSNVVTVVVEQESKIYGYRIPYRNDSILVDINDVNVSADRKPVKITESYVYVKDIKNKSYQSTYTADGDNLIKVSIDKLDETKTVKMQGIASKLAVPTRRTAVVIETKIKPVNVIDESIPGSGGGGGGGGGGGAGVLTEYWS